MHKRTLATSIPKEVKRKVWERDNHACIYCMRYLPVEFANSHFIKRSQGGLGIEQNIVTACSKCHWKYDSTYHYTKMYEYTLNYLKSKYPDLKIEDLVYNKYKEVQNEESNDHNTND